MYKQQPQRVRITPRWACRVVGGNKMQYMQLQFLADISSEHYILQDIPFTFWIPTDMVNLSAGTFYHTLVQHRSHLSVAFSSHSETSEYLDFMASTVERGNP